MSVDGMTVVVGTHKSVNEGPSSGHAKLFPYSSTKKKWNQLGNTLIGAASCDYSG